MAKEEKRLEYDKEVARKQRDRDYQNRRQERLNELGEKKISMRLDGTDYNKLAELFESLGYRRPEPGMRNLIEACSRVMKYLLRVERDFQIYEPKSPAAKELYNLYKTVNHLKYDMGYSYNKIVERLNKDKVRQPIAIIYCGKIYTWKIKNVKRLMDKDLLLRRLALLDEEE
ncbi:TPA: hypothetical protein ACNIQM_002955 [Citrobacter werkmanii]